MFNFLKICGKGLLAIILSPLWLSAFLLTAIFGLLLFIFNSVRILFIDLHNLFAKSEADIIDPLGDLPEDLEVQRIKKANEASLVQVVDTSSSDTSSVVTTTSPSITTPANSSFPNSPLTIEESSSTTTEATSSSPEDSSLEEERKEDEA